MGKIQNELEYENMIDICYNYTLTTSVALSLFDNMGNEIYCSGNEKAFLCEKTLCTAAFVNKPDQQIDEILSAGNFARRFGGRYIFFSSTGFACFIVPVVIKGIVYAFIRSEPILISDKKYFFDTEIERKYNFDEELINRLKLLYTTVIEIKPLRLHVLCEQLFINVSYFTSGFALKNILDIDDTLESQKLQSVISDYISQYKKNVDLESKQFYPLDKEDELLGAMAKGDKKEATALLNQILSHIFFYSGFKIEVIRSRVIELMTLLSRAAVKGGADMELVLGLNFNYLNEVDKLNTIEDLAHWLSIIMNRYMEYVFNFVAIKHVNTIYQLWRKTPILSYGDIRHGFS